jgi:hypothetical protein
MISLLGHLLRQRINVDRNALLFFNSYIMERIRNLIHLFYCFLFFLLYPFRLVMDDNSNVITCKTL